MNGKKAKQIRRRTKELLIALDISVYEGYGDYDQEKNCVTWELVETPDGKYMRDPDGGYFRKPVLTNGTIKSSWKCRLFYQWLKTMYKKGDFDAMEILNASPKELNRLSKLMGKDTNESLR